MSRHRHWQRFPETTPYVPKVDYEYEISEERIRAYLAVPEIERLRWLEELCIFTNQFRQAPAVSEPDSERPNQIEPPRPPRKTIQ